MEIFVFCIFWIVQEFQEFGEVVVMFNVFLMMLMVLIIGMFVYGCVQEVWFVWQWVVVEKDD